MEVGNAEKMSEMAMKIKKLEWWNKILRNSNRMLKMRMKTKEKCQKCMLGSMERNSLANKCEIHELHIEMLEKKYVEKLDKLHEAQQEITKLNKVIRQLQQQISGKNQVNQLESFNRENTVQETNIPDISSLLECHIVTGEQSISESVNLEIKKEPLDEINLYEICRNATNDNAEDFDSRDRNAEGAENSDSPNTDLEPTESFSDEGTSSNTLTCKWIGHDEATACGQVFATISELAGHFRDVHLDVPGTHGYVCRWNGCRRAGVPIKSKHYFIIHFRCHSGERPFRCSAEGCRMRFADRSTLRSHSYTHNRNTFPCRDPKCSKVFTHRHNMVEHYRVHHEGYERFKCPVAGCGKLSLSAYAQRVHMKKHSRKRMFPCGFPGCNESFPFKANLDTHLTTHALNQCFQCPFQGCHLKFNNVGVFQQHAYTHDAD